MSPSRIVLSAFVAAIALCSVAESVTTPPGSSRVPAWAQDAISDQWTVREGGSLEIDRDGAVRFLDSDGNLLQSAQITILSLEPAISVGLQLVSVGLFALSVNDTTFTIPGVWGAGEGDPMSLDLYVVPSPLTPRLVWWYRLGEGRVLRMRGTPP